jgi:hypothetical protein
MTGSRREADDWLRSVLLLAGLRKCKLTDPN